MGPGDCLIGPLADWVLAVQAADLSPTARRVGATFIRWAKADLSCDVWPAAGTIAHYLKLDVERARDALRELRAAGYLASTERKGTTNLYTLVPHDAPSPKLTLPEFDPTPKLGEPPPLNQGSPPPRIPGSEYRMEFGTNTEVPATLSLPGIDAPAAVAAEPKRKRRTPEERDAKDAAAKAATRAVIDWWHEAWKAAKSDKYAWSGRCTKAAKELAAVAPIEDLRPLLPFYWTTFVGERNPMLHTFVAHYAATREAAKKAGVLPRPNAAPTTTPSLRPVTPPRIRFTGPKTDVRLPYWQIKQMMDADDKNGTNLTGEYRERLRIAEAAAEAREQGVGAA